MWYDDHLLLYKWGTKWVPFVQLYSYIFTRKCIIHTYINSCNINISKLKVETFEVLLKRNCWFLLLSMLGIKIKKKKKKKEEKTIVFCTVTRSE